MRPVTRFGRIKVAAVTLSVAAHLAGLYGALARETDKTGGGGSGGGGGAIIAFSAAGGAPGLAATDATEHTLEAVEPNVTEPLEAYPVGALAPEAVEPIETRTAESTRPEEAVSVDASEMAATEAEAVAETESEPPERTELEAPSDPMAAESSPASSAETLEVPDPETLESVEQPEAALASTTVTALPRREEMSVPLPPERPSVIPERRAPPPEPTPPPARAEALPAPAPAPAPVEDTQVAALPPPPGDAVPAGVEAGGPSESGTGGAATGGESTGTGSATVGADSGAVARYMDQLAAWLQRHQVYPSRAQRRGIEGRAVVVFIFDGTGRVLDVRLAQSSGSEILDEAAVEVLHRASPLPPPPAGVEGTAVTLPLQYVLQSARR